MPEVKPKEKSVEVDIGKYTLLLIGGIILLFALFSTFAIVDAGNVGILKTFGQAQEPALQPGIHFKIPFAQEIIPMNYQTQKLDASASAASNDLQDVQSTVTVNYHLDKEQAVEVYNTNGTGYAEKVIPQAVQGSVKATTAKFTAEQLITNRASVRQGIEEQLKDDLAKYGIIVEKVEITNFNFSASFNAAIEAKVTAEQKALEAQNVLKQVEFEAQQKVAEARGLADSKVLQANADANAVLVVAQAQAEALRIQNQALAESQDVLQLRLIEKWNGIYPTYYWVGNESQAIVQVPSITGVGSP